MFEEKKIWAEDLNTTRPKIYGMRIVWVLSEVIGVLLNAYVWINLFFLFFFFAKIYKKILFTNKWNTPSFCLNEKTE